MSIIIQSPMAVPLSKKKQFILNLNNYRNLYFRALNISKIQYKEYIKEQIEREFYYPLEKVAITYTVYKGDRRRFDIGNVCSIHQKYFEDALVEIGKLPDDKSSNIPIVLYRFGGISQANPRVEIEVFNLKDKTDTSKLNQSFSQYLKELKRNEF